MAYIQRLQEQLAENTGFLLEQQQQMFRDRLADLINIIQKFLSSFLGDISGILLNFLLILVYTFLLLLNRSKLVDFVMMYVRDEKEEETKEIIQKTSKVAHGYLWGRIQVMITLAVMYAITFTAYGLEHSGLLILFGTLITIIPYLGPFLSGVLPTAFMIVYGDSSLEIISFAVIVLIIQLLESYVFEPVLIGYEVEQSPLFVIIAVLLGGALWGPAGLVLFVPLFAILKIIFDHSRVLQPVGFLIGYERPGAGEGMIEKIKKKLKI
jgi:predicted PurR-regulated permease PerM